MSTGHTSASLAAIAGSVTYWSSTSMPMNVASVRIGSPVLLRRDFDAALGELALHDLRDLGDLLRDRDAGLGEAGDLLGRGVLLALDDRAGMAEAHARHLVHEPAGHERHDRKARVVLGHPARQLGLHAAARLGVDDDALGLLVGLEQRH